MGVVRGDVGLAAVRGVVVAAVPADVAPSEGAGAVDAAGGSVRQIAAELAAAAAVGAVALRVDALAAAVGEPVEAHQDAAAHDAGVALGADHATAAAVLRVGGKFGTSRVAPGLTLGAARAIEPEQVDVVADAGPPVGVALPAVDAGCPLLAPIGVALRLQASRHQRAQRGEAQQDPVHGRLLVAIFGGY